ncbi:ARM repeat-containing protein [Punctularia strigosozonata HHB-11173 SS5]|uniref:ARM repeat-containing protein n=1 Tax=Punctularia strigosozonata (strain HHB-11173) TaxID=741275 RepID=UPI0004416601|nr:ARM repeat-containing protein [Punctularia strigosozonata HHB-11173 SS5]EIN06629.1 ARM repeat-containing protein [Punctularia strigosozonata HHB-11173 SS5]
MEDDTYHWSRERVLGDWPRAMQYGLVTLRASSTKARLQFLREDLLPLAKTPDLSLSQTLDVFKLLTQTYPRYVDSQSRDAVEAVGMELVRRDEARGVSSDPSETKFGVTEQIVGWLSNEVSRVIKRGSSYAATDRFVLLSWTCGVYTVCLQTNPDFPSVSSQPWNALLGVLAILIESILDPTGSTKPSIRQSSLTRTRRAFRSSPKSLPLTMSTLVTLSKSLPSPLITFPVLGIAVDVSIRLKDTKQAQLARVSPELKTRILDLFVSNVIMSKTPVPAHVSEALHDFIQSYITEDDIAGVVLPTAEKALLRAPENSLSVITDFFAAYPQSLSTEHFRRLLVPALNSAKSSNASVRKGALCLFKVLATKCPDEKTLQSAADEVLSLPKSGKTTGPDHRITLFSMLQYIPTSGTASPSILHTALPLLAKESHDAATTALATSLSSHLNHAVRFELSLDTGSISLLAKEMSSAKPTIRRAFCTLVGGALWEVPQVNGDVAKAVLPALEGNLKTAAVPGSAAPMEGYVAIALILGPYARSGMYDDAISKNVVIQSLANPSTKPAFLINEKVYMKLEGSEDEIWLLRAANAATSYLRGPLSKSELLRSQLGQVLVHLAVESKAADVRRATLQAVESLAQTLPEVVGLVVVDSLTAFLSKEKTTVAKTNGPDDDTELTHNANDRSRLAAFVLAAVTPGEDTDLAVREVIAANLLIVGHHPMTCAPGRQVWIELCQKGRIDPRELVRNSLDHLLKLVLGASNSALSGFADASYRAVATLTFVAPEDVLPRMVEQLRADVDGRAINSLTETDLGIWRTSPGTTYVDVLTNKNGDVVEKKGKDRDIAKWEAEVRKSVANKKAPGATPILTKQQQALVKAQLDKEAEIRQKVEGLKTNLERGLRIISSLVFARVEEIKAYVTPISSILLENAFDIGPTVVGSKVFDTYLELAQCCSHRLDSVSRWIGVATLRLHEVKGVPEDYQIEPLSSLVLRVLYRFHSLSSQTSFDAATFCYMAPLLSQVMMKGGIAVNEDDDPLEQIVLCLDIIRYHCADLADITFPRYEVMRALIHVIQQQPRLGKDASSVLVDVGQAIHGTAVAYETNLLLATTLAQEAYLRHSALLTLQPFDLTDLEWSPELWVAVHDEDEQNARLAQHLWEDNGLDVPETFLPPLLNYLADHEHESVRSSAARGLSEAVEQWPQTVGEVVIALEQFYREKARILAPEFDEYGMIIEASVGRVDPWPTRAAISRALELLAPLIPSESVLPLFKFFIKDEALGDRHEVVRKGMLNAAIATIDAHGATQSAALLSIFEDELAAGAASSTETSDFIKEAVVVLLGRTATHLEPSDARIPKIVNRLVEALKTPSEQVQIAVADCLAPLVKIMDSPVGPLVDKLLDELFNASKYAARRGAAYGLAGVVRGYGVTSFKEFDLFKRLSAGAEDKKRYESRQGALFAFETMSSTLGRLFEPYIIHILPVLLASFGDSTADVREAAQDTARIIMANMSGYGVKLILPSLLEGLEEKQWRTKKGSIELLGMMAYCAPRQLSQSLPIVIPQLTDVLTDSHAQVRAAANQSLKQFGEVISNPEIQKLAPTLLKALVDPARTPNALNSLLKTSFMHYIDQSSLALIIPIIERGLKERGAETKRRAARIVGNLASLTDSKDYVPYLPELLPMVHAVLIDPVPEARATAAKALGALVERLGEQNFPDLVPSLIRTLKGDSSGVDRQGAAQGLSEVLSGLGMERMEGLLPDIIANAQSPRSTVREGFMSLLVYLPATFGTRFQPHLPKIITPILSGLSDIEEYVREAAMRAGRMVITNYSNKAIDLLLPELERGIFDPGWRIRQSSITLVGELLFKVSGISGKAEIEEDEEEPTDAVVAESSRKALVEVLGRERRDRILSALYLARQDAVSVVRQSSIHIWKALVHNTPRTVREILPELVDQIITLLSSSEYEQEETASRTIGELCRKSGDRVLSEIIGLLRTRSTSSDARIREGVCLALSELMVNTTDTQREGREDEIILMVRTSLVDDEANVRSAAARAFDILQEHLGTRAIDQTIPTLLEALRQPGASSGTALHALKEVMSVRASTVFPVLIPTLTASPMTLFNARALATLVTVAGNALSRRLTVVLTALVKELESKPSEELQEAIQEAVEALLRSIADEEGLNTLMLMLLGWAKHEAPQRRVSACNLFATFCEVTELDTSLYRIDWIRQLVTLLDDDSVPVHTAAWSAFDAFVKSTPKDELEPLVVPLRRTIESTGGPGRYVPGFSLPKGVGPMVPIIIAGLTTGSNEQREQAAYAIGDLVERTEEAAIKPFVVPFTGPLIRVATQATTYPPGVKVAILSALGTMLERIPTFVKPFFPQLQRTFVKGASDPSSLAVRNKAAESLGSLMKSQPRVDPVITELVTGARSNDEEIAGSLVLALARVVRSADANIGESARQACVDLVSDAFREAHHGECPFSSAQGYSLIVFRSLYSLDCCTVCRTR